MKCIEDEIPFEVPDGWEWCRLRNITQFLGGYAYKSSKYIGESKNIVIRMGNIKNNELRPYITKTCISDEYAVETSSYAICQNDILFTMTGTRGKRDYFYSCLVNAEDLHDTNLYLNQRVGCLRIFDINRIHPSYLVTVLQSRSVLNAIFETETGNVSQGNIGSAATLNLLIPIPPTREQFAIHTTVQSILELIGTYEIAKKELHSIIGILKAKILDLAIRGKLVPQNPTDEPASVLLERIHAEKEELIKQGKIKRDKKEAVIFKGEDNSYYEKYGEELPQGWVVTNLESLLSYEQPTNYIVESTDYSNNFSTPVLTAGKSFILGYTNETTGIYRRIPTIIFDDFTTESKYVDFEFKVKSSAVKILTANTNLVLIRFAYYLMQSIDIDHDNHQRYWLSVFSKQEVALPPLAEQQRIVEQIDYLYSLLDNMLS